MTLRKFSVTFSTVSLLKGSMQALQASLRANLHKIKAIPPLVSHGHILAKVNGCLGLIMLNRAQARNAFFVSPWTPDVHPLKDLA